MLTKYINGVSKVTQTSRIIPMILCVAPIIWSSCNANNSETVANTDYTYTETKVTSNPKASGSTTVSPVDGFLYFADKPSTAKQMVAHLCLRDSRALQGLDTWMPDMGHGSGALGWSIDANFGPNPFAGDPLSACYMVKGIQLTMPGHWQIRVKYNDNSMGVFDFNAN
jgi:hypothetical protein